jgi:hypothetical protein
MAGDNRLNRNEKAPYQTPEGRTGRRTGPKGGKSFPAKFAGSVPAGGIEVPAAALEMELERTIARFELRIGGIYEREI